MTTTTTTTTTIMTSPQQEENNVETHRSTKSPHIDKTETKTTKSIILSTLLATTASSEKIERTYKKNFFFPGDKQGPGENFSSTMTTPVNTNTVKFEFDIKSIAIGAGVVLLILIIITIVCTYLCVKNCHRKAESRRESNAPRYPRSNTMSNLSYISHMARMRDFDGESEDSGIDEKSVLKSKNSIPIIENGDNLRNYELEGLNGDAGSEPPHPMEQHL